MLRADCTLDCIQVCIREVCDGWGDADVDGLGDGCPAVDVDGLGDGGLLTGTAAAVDVDGLGEGGGGDGDTGLLSLHGDLVAGTAGLI